MLKVLMILFFLKTTSSMNLRSVNMKIFLSVLSDPLSASSLESIQRLMGYLKRSGIHCDLADEPCWLIDPKIRADQWNHALRSGEYDWIFDISGGNLANLCAPYLDYSANKASKCIFAGFSDLSCLLNAVSFKTQRPTLLYALYYQRNLNTILELLHIHKDLIGLTNQSKERDIPKTSCRSNPLHSRLSVSIHIPEEKSGFSMDEFNTGKSLGGNIRCFLKLAGTDSFPDLTDHTLVLEGMGTSKYEFLSLMEQLNMMKAFEQASQVLFGCFSKIMQETGREGYEDFLLWAMDYLEIDIPWAWTDQVGHVENGKPILLEA